MSTVPAPECPDCHGPTPNYDHIHGATTLPRRTHTNDHVVTPGYAVGMSGVGGQGLPQTWVFFEDVEPALVFGRAGRMSGGDISGYGVYEAAAEVRFNGRRDVTTLHVKSDQPSLDRGEGEAEVFARWVAGCDPTSSYFQRGR